MKSESGLTFQVTGEQKWKREGERERGISLQKKRFLLRESERERDRH